MILVEILRRDPMTAAAEVIIRVAADGPGLAARIEIVSPHGELLAETLASDGVPDERGLMIDISDGEAFARALPGAYRGSRLWAEIRD